MMRQLIACLWLCCSLVGAEEIVGKVVGVADGDTITVLDAAKVQHKVRLEGIDAPEKSQPYGAKATEAIKQALGDGQVVVRVSTVDRYGRSVGRVMVGSLDLNAWMIQQGWAWHYKAYSKDPALAALEQRARAAKAGLWADPVAPQAPWDFRAAARQGKAVQPASTNVPTVSNQAR